MVILCLSSHFLHWVSSAQRAHRDSCQPSKWSQNFSERSGNSYWQLAIETRRHFYIRWIRLLPYWLGGHKLLASKDNMWAVVIKPNIHWNMNLRFRRNLCLQTIWNIVYLITHSESQNYLVSDLSHFGSTERYSSRRKLAGLQRLFRWVNNNCQRINYKNLFVRFVFKMASWIALSNQSPSVSSSLRPSFLCCAHKMNARLHFLLEVALFSMFVT